jgi:hypothetical protein
VRRSWGNSEEMQKEMRRFMRNYNAEASRAAAKTCYKEVFIKSPGLRSLGAA